MPGRGRMLDSARFAMVPRSDVPRSAFDVTHCHKTTFDAGELVPIYVDEVLPGDSFKLRMTAFARLSTPLVPIMDNMALESFFFYVPNRLLWEHWERFMGEQDNPTDSTVFLTPMLSLNDADLVPGSMADYFGITNNVSGAPVLVNAFHFRAYNQIYNDWFRDEDLSIKAVIDISDGPDTPLNYPLQARAKRFDYFTSARPWPEKPMNVQDTSNVLLGPLAPGGRFTGPTSGAPVTGLGVGPFVAPTATPQDIYMSGTRTSLANNPHWSTTDDAFFMEVGAGNSPNVRVLVNDMRTAILIQGMLERNARGGTRYNEIVRNHFGVTSPDQRLQRSEYLGGGRTMVNVNPVAQTSATGVAGTTTVLAELSGIATAVASNHGFSRSFTEHGVIIGLINVRADLTYQQGINRMWSRRTQFDFYWPGLAHLGEQAITSREIYADGSAGDNTVFGYQERWSEYKYKPSRTSGMFRSTVATPLDVWHLAELFGARPVLNGIFLTEPPPIDRVSQVVTNYGEQFLLDALFDVRMVRPMPMYSIPGLGARL